MTAQSILTIVLAIGTVTGPLLTWLLTRGERRADAELAEARTDRIRLEAYVKSVEYLEKRVAIVELQVSAERAAVEYLTEHVNPAVAAEARALRDRIMAGLPA